MISKPLAPVSLDASNPAQILAAMVQPYIQASVADVDKRISDAVTKAIKTAMEHLPVNRIEIVFPDLELKTIDGQHECFARLLKRVMRRKHVYLYGGPGSGKSTAGFKVADALGLRHGYISLTAQTGESRLMGYMDATGNYIKTEFFTCYTQGGVFVIDEADNASANLLTSLNGALANGHAAFPCGNMPRHADFVCIATGNTCGWGANPMFPERRPMDAAFRERFAFIEWGYDETFEKSLALAFNPNASTWIKWVQSTRKYAASTYPKLMVTPRASIEGAQMLLDGETYPVIADELIFKGFDKDSVTRILAACPLPKK